MTMKIIKVNSCISHKMTDTYSYIWWAFVFTGTVFNAKSLLTKRPKTDQAKFQAKFSCVYNLGVKMSINFQLAKNISAVSILI